MCEGPGAGAEIQGENPGCSIRKDTLGGSIGLWCFLRKEIPSYLARRLVEINGRKRAPVEHDSGY